MPKPLNKMFGTFKATVELTNQEANLIYKNNMGRKKIPISTLFALEATDIRLNRDKKKRFMSF